MLVFLLWLLFECAQVVCVSRCLGIELDLFCMVGVLVIKSVFYTGFFVGGEGNCSVQ